MVLSGTTLPALDHGAESPAGSPSPRAAGSSSAADQHGHGGRGAPSGLLRAFRRAKASYLSREQFAIAPKADLIGAAGKPNSLRRLFRQTGNIELRAATL